MITKKYGGLKIVWHPDKLSALRDGKITAPISVRVKPTNRCDHNCFYCSYNPDAEDVNILSQEFRRNDEILKEKIMEILDDFKNMGVKAITFSGGGEPLVYSHIKKTLEHTLNNGIDLSMITNGQKLKGVKADYLSQAKWVRISLDACKAESFVKSRRTNERFFYELVKNIKNFAKIKSRKCELGINFVVHEFNQDEVYDAVGFFRDLGANHIKFTPRWIDNKEKWKQYHAPFKEQVIAQIKKAKKNFPDFDIFDTYENDFLLTGVPERSYTKCPIMQIVPVIGADSVVYFCHDKTYTKSGVLGSIKERSFRDLWFSKETAEKFKNFNPSKECRQHCTYDARNILINDIINNYGEHLNFP